MKKISMERYMKGIKIGFIGLALVGITGLVILMNNKSIDTIKAEKINSGEFFYTNIDLGVSFAYPNTTEVLNETKTYDSTSNRQLSLVLSDSTLITNNLKDDERYLIFEVWKPDAPYVQKTCFEGPEGAVKSKVFVSGIQSENLTYTDKYSRNHHDICINSREKIYILKSSVSSELGNEQRINQLLQTVLVSLKFL